MVIDDLMYTVQYYTQFCRGNSELRQHKATTYLQHNTPDACIEIMSVCIFFVWIWESLSTIISLGLLPFSEEINIHSKEKKTKMEGKNGEREKGNNVTVDARHDRDEAGRANERVHACGWWVGPSKPLEELPLEPRGRRGGGRQRHGGHRRR